MSKRIRQYEFIYIYIFGYYFTDNDVYFLFNKYLLNYENTHALICSIVVNVVRKNITLIKEGKKRNLIMSQ